MKTFIEAFYLWRKLFQNDSRLQASLEVSLMTSKLHPWISLLVPVGLEERRPLHNVAQLPPTDH